jgi:hypothetical protein
MMKADMKEESGAMGVPREDESASAVGGRQ